MLLSPYRVLDLTDDLGFLTGKIFGDLGAEVIKIEPPLGDPARRRPPFLKNGNGSSQSLYWQAYNTNKRGITLDLHQQQGRDLFFRLAKTADFIIESFQPGTLEEWGLQYEFLSREHPGLILVSITPFGQEGPYRDFLGSDLEIMALSGAMSLAGEKDGEPMRVSVPQSPMWVGAEAVMGALTALAYRTLTGKGQHVDVSAQVAVMAALAHAPAFWDLNRVNAQRAGIYVTGRSVNGAAIRISNSFVGWMRREWLLDGSNRSTGARSRLRVLHKRMWTNSRFPSLSFFRPFPNRNSLKALSSVRYLAIRFRLLKTFTKTHSLKPGNSGRMSAP